MVKNIRNKVTLAQDTSIDDAIDAHEALTDPHTGYVKETDATWITLRMAAEVPSGAPSGTEMKFAIDTTAVTGGLYYWNGSAWVLIVTIP